MKKSRVVRVAVALLALALGMQLLACKVVYSFLHAQLQDLGSDLEFLRHEPVARTYVAASRIELAWSGRFSRSVEHGLSNLLAMMRLISEEESQHMQRTQFLGNRKRSRAALGPRPVTHAFEDFHGVPLDHSQARAVARPEGQRPEMSSVRATLLSTGTDHHWVSFACMIVSVVFCGSCCSFLAFRVAMARMLSRVNQLPV
ncbi:hypothetical protein FVE85_3347 [Porphyridium purpureum]|uniref:Uncharacterized protein n=1 Tax=Porphyridium purpureum TaxID=35688 RepID=A0A5J4YUS8_PORPP|nr:hypothetical protein FVE85_3347 [Porphyridium purpureum]|eukprot:POR1062..scf227_4